MTVNFRNYNDEPGISPDYYKVRDFFIRLGYAEYTYARWDWMITHSYLDPALLKHIGLWQVNDEIVGIACFDIGLGTAYCLTLDEYKHLKGEIILYAKDHLSEGNTFGLIIPDEDIEYKKLAKSLGFVSTPHGEKDAIIYKENLDHAYNLPEGYKIISLEEDYDLYQYRRVLWYGFNHGIDEGEFLYDEEVEASAKHEMERPNLSLDLKIAVVAPNGDYVSYCGMWYDETAGYSVIEPVATIPEYRKMGLARAAVMEGIKRTMVRGAVYSVVGSSQQFYYSIGMMPHKTSSKWIYKTE